MRNSIFTLLLAFVIVNSQAQTKMTLEDCSPMGKFMSKSIRGLKSMKDGVHYTALENGSQIVRYSYQTGLKTAVVFDLNTVENAAIQRFNAYEFSDDETKILLTTDEESIYRHSFTAIYYIWNSVTGELLPLSEKGKQQLATFSPDGERVAFVRNNNLFIKNLKFGTEIQVTLDGQKNKIINGAPDWVYEEEFGFSKAFAWSPDSKFLAFIRFDETFVPEFGMTMFRGDKPALPKNSLYPQNETFKYPKAGETNSKVEVRVYDIKSKGTVTASLGKDTSMYIPRIKWTPAGNDLAVMQMNRRQNQLDVLYVNPYTGDGRMIYREKNDRFVDEDFLDKFTFLNDGSFVLTSERSGYSHLYLHDRQGFELARLTKGNFDVTNFYGFDPVKKLFYYQAAAESPLRREVYFTSQDGKKNGKLSTLTGTNQAVFSNGYKYFINYFNNANTPNLITLHDSNGKQIRVLENNEDLKQKLKPYALAKKEFFSFKTSEGIELNGWIMKPAATNPNQKFPIIITQYSGPNSQQVTDSWSVGWNNYLVQEGFAVICVDPRGTGARGQDFRKTTYMQLGKYESDDMVETAKFLARQPYADSKNMAIWGWSYGGLMVALSMEKGGELFKAGIAVAPVTSWRFYDTIYTERYMRTPQENAEGYDDNSPLSHAGKIKGRLLLIHGSADDNVHVQNSMEFSEAMVQAGIQFEMAIYTNRNHGIRGGNTYLHLYQRMTDFLKTQLMQ